MKALILNSGIGHRMGGITKGHPKCMTEIDGAETILNRQLATLFEFGIYDVVMTAGCYDSALTDCYASLELPLNIPFVKKRNLRKDKLHLFDIFSPRISLDGTVFNPVPYDAAWLSHPIWEFGILSKIGEKELAHINEILKDALGNKTIAQNINAIRGECWENEGNGGSAIFGYLMDKQKVLSKGK